ncbi:hypothetical protein CYMTET_41163 [Cymbomonas tetramitiformis]|uniref:Uncharacterized protein n=1 Tax=Cymbomonas tetramitiformis TaxID=36881 RepID=A0AAE0C6P3_9CHLO|nr:hypothetical protein CYMTET_41163 [Cymbomonas tetramitiformis]
MWSLPFGLTLGTRSPLAIAAVSIPIFTGTIGHYFLETAVSNRLNDRLRVAMVEESPPERPNTNLWLASLGQVFQMMASSQTDSQLFFGPLVVVMGAEAVTKDDKFPGPGAGNTIKIPRTAKSECLSGSLLHNVLDLVLNPHIDSHWSNLVTQALQISEPVKHRLAPEWFQRRRIQMFTLALLRHLPLPDEEVARQNVAAEDVTTNLRGSQPLTVLLPAWPSEGQCEAATMIQQLLERRVQVALPGEGLGLHQLQPRMLALEKQFYGPVSQTMPNAPTVVYAQDPGSGSENDMSQGAETAQRENVLGPTPDQGSYQEGNQKGNEDSNGTLGVASREVGARQGVVMVVWPPVEDVICAADSSDAAALRSLEAALQDPTSDGHMPGWEPTFLWDVLSRIASPPTVGIMEKGLEELQASGHPSHGEAWDALTECLLGSSFGDQQLEALLDAGLVRYTEPVVVHAGDLQGGVAHPQGVVGITASDSMLQAFRGLQVLSAGDRDEMPKAKCMLHIIRTVF